MVIMLNQYKVAVMVCGLLRCGRRQLDIRTGDMCAYISSLMLITYQIYSSYDT